MKINIIFKSVGLAMGVAFVALSIMKQLSTKKMEQALSRFKGE